MAHRVLNVYLDGRLVGRAHQSAQGALSFTYDEDYVVDPDATPLSMSMPTDVATHRNKPVRVYLEGLLPDSPAARERWGRQYNVSPNNAFALLAHVGRDAAGAVQVLPPDMPASDASARTGNIEWLSDQDFADMARTLAVKGADWDPGRFGGRWYPCPGRSRSWCCSGTRTPGAGGSHGTPRPPRTSEAGHQRVRAAPRRRGAVPDRGRTSRTVGGHGGARRRR